MITAQGKILACCNDTSGVTAHGNVASTCWPEVVAWKREVVDVDAWFAPCADCDDDYRWVILANEGVDIRERDEIPTLAGGGQ